MKVLRDNFKQYTYIERNDNEFPKKLVCENCESELEYGKSDIFAGEYGCATVSCPLCGTVNYLDDGEHDLVLTADNVEFPTHFSHCSNYTGAVDCFNNEEIKKYIYKGIEYFRRNKDANFWFTCTGNLYICISRWEGDENYWIVASNDHYDTYIPFEAADY